MKKIKIPAVPPVTIRLFHLEGAKKGHFRAWAIAKEFTKEIKPWPRVIFEIKLGSEELRFAVEAETAMEIGAQISSVARKMVRSKKADDQ